jgi:hypothetical protein
VNDSQRKRYRNCRVDGVSTFSENVDSNLRCEFVRARDDSCPRPFGLTDHRPFRFEFPSTLGNFLRYAGRPN